MPNSHGVVEDERKLYMKQIVRLTTRRVQILMIVFEVISISRAQAGTPRQKHGLQSVNPTVTVCYHHSSYTTNEDCATSDVDNNVSCSITFDYEPAAVC